VRFNGTLWLHDIIVFWGVYVQCLIIICVVVQQTPVAPDHSNLLLAVYAVLRLAGLLRGVAAVAAAAAMGPIAVRAAFQPTRMRWLILRSSTHSIT
jgi:hypothetical protein